MEGQQVAQLHPHLVLGAARRGDVVVVVRTHRQLLARLCELFVLDEVLDHALSLGRVKHKVTAVDPNDRLADTQIDGPVDVQSPNPFVLGDGEGLQSSIEDFATTSAFLKSN